MRNYILSRGEGFFAKTYPNKKPKGSEAANKYIRITASLAMFIAAIVMANPSAYALRGMSDTVVYINNRVCLPDDYELPPAITSNVIRYVNENLIGFSIGDYTALEYKGEIFYRYETFDGVGNKFYIISDACQQVLGPYFHTARLDFFE